MESCAPSCNGAELLGPVERIPRPQDRSPSLDPHLHAIAVELDLVNPSRRRSRAGDQRAKFGGHELRHRLGLPGCRRPGFGVLRLAGSPCRFGSLGGFRRCLDRLIGVGRLVSIGVPDGVGRGRRVLGQHEGVRLPALALGDLLYRAARRHGAVLVQHGLAVAVLGVAVMVLDQQPIGPFAATQLVVAQPDQDPAAMQLFALEPELEFALVERVGRRRRLLRLPIPAIPQQDGTAAILTFGDGAFEVAIIQRMILDLHGKALVMRVQRWPSGDCPRLEYTVELEPQIVMQTSCSMLLDDEAETRSRGNDHLPARLGRLLEIPFGRIVGQLSLRHPEPPALPSGNDS